MASVLQKAYVHGCFRRQPPEPTKCCSANSRFATKDVKSRHEHLGKEAKSWPKKNGKT